MTSTNDLDLLRKFAHDRSQDAFTSLVQRHLNLVYCAALRQVRSPQLAEEVAQSVFTDLANNAARLKPDTVLTAWLYQVTRRTAINVVRSEARRQFREQIALEMNMMNATADDWTQIEPILDEAMHALDDIDRTAVLLRYFENKSLREVGETLGTTDDTARKRVNRAVEHLREFFTKRGIPVGAGGLVAAVSANAVQAAPMGLAATVSTTAVVAGTTFATATKIIAMTTLQKAVAGATLAVAVGTGIYEASRISTLRDEVRTFQQRQAPMSRQILALQQERDAGAQQLAAVRGDNERLNRNNAELLRLRGEVSMLRREKARLSAAQADTTVVTGADEPAGTPALAFGTELRDLGARTPEQAATSLIWAATAGQGARVSELLELPKGVSEVDAASHYGFFTKQLSNVFNSMEFLSVQGVKPDPDETLRVNFAYREISTGKTNAFPFMLRLHESGWKVVVEGNPPPVLPVGRRFQQDLKEPCVYSIPGCLAAMWARST